MPVPIVYRKAKQPNLVQFSFTDWVNNTGYATYYAMKSRDGSGILCPAAIDADYLGFFDQLSVTGSTEENFDLTFSKQAVMRGPLYFSHTYGGRVFAGGSSFATYTTVRVLHVTSAGTETEIGASQTSETCSFAASGNSKAFRKTLKFDISKKVFKPTDKLRIEVIVNSTIIGSAYGFLWFDPTDRMTDVGAFAAGTDPNGYLPSPQNMDMRVLVPFVQS